MSHGQATRLVRTMPRKCDGFASGNAGSVDRGDQIDLGGVLDGKQDLVGAGLADFIGDANLVTGVLESKAGDKATVRIAGVSVNLPHRDQAPGEVKLAIRPEAIMLEAVKPEIGRAHV